MQNNKLGHRVFMIFALKPCAIACSFEIFLPYTGLYPTLECLQQVFFLHRRPLVITKMDEEKLDFSKITNYPKLGCFYTVTIYLFYPDGRCEANPKYDEDGKIFC
jgi:hypothetical protein